MNSIKTVVISFLMSISILGMAQDVTKELEISILPYKVVTNGAFFKAMVLSSPDCYVEYLAGFDFEWGFEYRLCVQETHLANPPADGSSYRYKLVKVVSKTAVNQGYTFELGLSRDLYLGRGTDQVSNFKYVNDSTYLYMDEIKIEYPLEKKAVLNEILNQNKYKKGTFEFVDQNTIRLK